MVAPLSEFQQSIVDLIAGSRYLRATASTLRIKLRTNSFRVQLALDQMASRGILAIFESGKTIYYRNVVDGLVVDPNPIGQTDDSEEAQAADTLSYEQQRAAQQWQARLGEQRWHDDPRAVAEHMHRQSMVPPFYNLSRRET